MITIEQFQQIKKYQQKGLTAPRTARRMELTSSTVRKYYKMEEDAFRKQNEKERKKRISSKCDQYRDELVRLIREEPDRSAANIYDHLLEGHGELPFSERTIRRYTAQLRKELKIPKRPEVRNYEAVEVPPAGQQAQVDFGEVNVRLSEDKSKQKKLYFFVMVLRYSRYKYVEFSDRKFNSKTAIEAHLNAFTYFGGIPREIVYDQDKVFIVSENSGDLIETAAFKEFLMEMPFTHYVAKKSDPETKGCVEKYVSFVKHNFVKGRSYQSLQAFNESALSWLKRTGNNKVCQTNNKKPVDLLAEDQQGMYPLEQLYKQRVPNEEIKPYQINKDNTVSYKGNKYRLPYGCYNKMKNHEIGVQQIADQLYFFDLSANSVLTSHPVSEERGKIIGEKEAKPLSLASCEGLIEAVQYLSKYVNTEFFLNQVCLRYQRYIPEQMQEIVSAFEENENITKELVKKTVEECEKQQYYSGTFFRETLTAYCEAAKKEEQKKTEEASTGEEDESPETCRFIYEGPTQEYKDYMKKLGRMWDSV